MENNNHLASGLLLILFSLLSLVVLCFTFKVFGLAGVSVYEFTMKDSEAQIKLLESLKIVAPVIAPKKIVKPRVVPKETKPATLPDKLNLDKLAYAVAMAETGNCTKGYGKTYNNCFGIKSGNTAPCKKTGKNRMCIYEKPEESYTAFKKIWSTWYKTFPTHRQAITWTGADSAITWRKHVLHFYYQ